METHRAKRRLGLTRPSGVAKRGKVTLAAGGYVRATGRLGGAGEVKFHDSNIASANVPVGGVVNSSINLIPVGTGENNRVGRKFTIRHIGMRGAFKLPSTIVPASTSDIVRIILYVDKQTNGATIAVTDLLETANEASPYNLANQNRFRILMDRRVLLDAQCGAWDGTNNEYGEVNKLVQLSKSVTIPIEYSATAAAITGVRSNNVGYMVIALKGLISSQILRWRVRFTDA